MPCGPPSPLAVRSAVLYAAFAPIPNELVVIPMAFMRCSLAGVMTAVLCGNVIFNALMASGASWFVGWWA